MSIILMIIQRITNLIVIIPVKYIVKSNIIAKYLIWDHRNYLWKTEVLMELMLSKRIKTIDTIV